MRIKEHPILDFNRGKKVKFSFDGKKMEGYENEPIAAALVASEVKILSYSLKLKRPRGFFCAVGKCSSCLMKVNGVRNVRTCVIKLEEGMEVETQKERGEEN